MGDDSRQTAAAVAAAVRRAGGRAYLVGGCVRDALLGRDADDFDIEVFSLSKEQLARALAEKFRVDFVGSSFGVFKIQGAGIDVSLPRKERKTGPGHRDFEMDFSPGMSLEEAAERRDFTINAVYMDPASGEIYDPFGGREDLEKKILRRVSHRFSVDPLRVLRGMQFAARFDLSADEDTIRECRNMPWDGIAPERVFAEWSKLLVKGDKISKGLSFLRETGWTRAYPELEALIGCPQEREWHPEGDVWNHTLACLDAFATERGDDPGEEEIIGFAVLCHDFGKPVSTFYDKKKNRIRSIGHDEKGVERAKSFLGRMTREERILKSVPPLVKYHMRPFAMWRAQSGDSAVRRLSANVGRIDRLLRVASADDAGRSPYPRNPLPVEWLAEKARRLEIESSAPKPLVMGRDLIAAGLVPGKSFGVVLKNLFLAQLDGKFSTKEQGIDFLLKNIKRFSA